MQAILRATRFALFAQALERVRCVAESCPRIILSNESGLFAWCTCWVCCFGFVDRALLPAALLGLRSCHLSSLAAPCCLARESRLSGTHRVAFSSSCTLFVFLFSPAGLSTKCLPRLHTNPGGCCSRSSTAGCSKAEASRCQSRALAVRSLQCIPQPGYARGGTVALAASRSALPLSLL